MYELRVYADSDSSIWNNFVTQAKNATFLFDRSYMDYHNDRFIDASLLIYRKNKLFALFPANVDMECRTVFSHQGLTYGGLILDSKAVISDILTIFELITTYYKNQGIQTMIYKPIPYIYHRYPSQEDLYVLFRFHAKLIGRNFSSTIYQPTKLSFSESRKSGLRKAKKNGIEITRSEDYMPFWNILSDNLHSKYATLPVHSIDEIHLLQTKFSGNIRHYTAQNQGEVVAGVVMYESATVAHVQYISANEDGKNTGALDLLFDYLINEVYTHVEWFDFGHSTDQMGNYLNDNLVFQKEGFGGRGVTYDIYELNL